MATIEELMSNASEQCRETFTFLRSQLIANQSVVETVDYEPLKEQEAPTYEVSGTPRLRAFFGAKLELFMFIPEKAVATIQNDSTIPGMLRGLVERAQLGGMSRLLRIQLGSKDDAKVIMPLIEAIIKA
jgi:hypothetical protein